MARPVRLLLVLALAALSCCAALAGEAYLLDREAALSVYGSAPASEALVRDAEGVAAYLVLDGRILPCRWAFPVLERQDPFGSAVGRVIPVPVDPRNQWLVVLAQNCQNYQVWRHGGGVWSQVAAGDLGARVIAATGGRFAAGEGAGLYAQFDSGRIGYWQVGPEGCQPVWRSPEPLAISVAAHHGDLDGDGLDEVLTYTAAGEISILRWRNGVWENVWSLPSWGQILGIDLGQADDLPGLEVAVVYSQRRLFLIGAASGGFTVKARFTTAMVASHVALLPESKGAVLLGDAAGTLYLFLPEAGTWRQESTLRANEKLSFLTGLGPERALAGTLSGSLSVLHVESLGRLMVFFDGAEVANKGLYWDDDGFYFGLEFLLQNVLGFDGRWDEKKATLTLIRDSISVVMQAGKAEASIDGRPWPIGRALTVVNKTPFVPEELLRSVFLINVTHDPVSNWLILTSPSAGAP